MDHVKSIYYTTILKKNPKKSISIFSVFVVRQIRQNRRVTGIIEFSNQI